MENSAWAVAAGGIGLLASAVTASLTYFFTKRNQLAMENRRLKEECYRAFMKALGDLVVNNSDREAHDRFSDNFNSVFLIADVQVVKALLEFHSVLRVDVQENVLARGRKEHISRYQRALTNLVKALRKDLLADNSDADEFPEIYFLGKMPPEFFEKKASV